MKIEPFARLERHAKRVGEIVSVLSRYGLADRFGSFDYPWVKQFLRSGQGEDLTELSTNERLRMALTDLGTTFIKLGQMLSTRADLIGVPLAEELAHLQANVPADAPEVAREAIKASLGKGVGEVFAHFEDEPLAAASIAQVHRATTREGEKVVVKVRRHGIHEKVTNDLEIVLWLASLLEKHSPTLRRYQPVAVAEQFQRTLLQELDYSFERSNLERFARNFANDETVRIPLVYEEGCSHDVLTMQFMDGLSGTKVEALKASGVDLPEFAKRGARMYLNMVFRDGFYHADPHPGNLMLMENGVVGVLDAGMVGRLDDDLREGIESLLLAIVDKDANEITEQVLRLGAVPGQLPREKLQSDLQDFLIDYLGRPLNELDIGGALTKLIEIIRRHQIVLPPQLAMLLKTLILLEGTSRRFDPDFSLAELVQPFCVDMAKRRMSPGRVMKKLRRNYRDWDRLVSDLPRDLGELIARFRDGSLTVHLDHRHLDPVVNRLVIGIITAAMFLGSSLLWSNQAPPLLWGVSVFGALGYMVAMFLGFRLLLAIRRSGNIQSKE